MVKGELGAMPKKKPALLGACSLQSQILQICGGEKLLSDLCHFHLIESDLKLRYADKVGDRLVSDFGPEITAVRDRILAPAAILRDAVKGRVTAARRLTKILRYHYAAQYLRIGIDNGVPARPTAVLRERVGSGGAWCHRSLLATWFSEELGIVVPEWGYEDCAVHPLLPPSLRSQHEEKSCS